MEYSSVFVCLMGLGTVFFGLVCIILLTMLMSAICNLQQPVSAITTPAATSQATATPATSASASPEPNQQELIAAVSAALAEDLGTHVTGIRILSIRKL